MFPLPSAKERLDIFGLFTKKMPLGKDVDLEQIAEKAVFFTGADIESTCREAAIRALRENIRAKIIHNEHFEEAMRETHPMLARMYANGMKNLKIRSK